MGIEKISDKIWKISGDSNIYFFDLDEKFIIDAGNRKDYNFIKFEFEKICKPEEVKKIILTHMHYDHIGCFDIFPNAKIYASKSAVEDFEKNPFGSILKAEICEMFEKVKINRLQKLDGFKIIETPGHTRGSICLLYEEEKILFSGDTLFDRGMVGRTDLPTSVPDELDKSLDKLRALDYEKLCPGHDY